MILLNDQRIDFVLTLAVSLVLLSVLYGVLMLVLSRFEPAYARRRAVTFPATAAEKAIIFVVPCLNEERVLAANLDRLVEMDYPRMQVLVIDDGSDDGTAAIVQAHPDPRVSLLQRRLPTARQGKGEALNAAIRHIRSGALGAYTDPSDVVVCVVDADGRMEPQALDEVIPLFVDPRLGAVQIGVRINNRHQNLLARMQDIEFVLYTEVFQRARRHLGSVGLGGNGQFVRLSALISLGPAPWSRSLAEDLDLGVRLLIKGWNIEFCSTSAVHQQGLVDVRRWVKQRTRWFQGHLQAWTLVPWVLRDLTGARRVDLLYHLTSPYLLLLASFLSAGFLLWIVSIGIGVFAGSLDFSWVWVSAYAVAFGPALMFGALYWRRERAHSFGPLTALVVLHAYVGYAVLWYVAGWKAAFRSLAGRNSWAKTDRTADDQDSAPGELDNPLTAPA
jgi:1,2-diacylglycerol 3-beta-glucosyltransferase